MNYRRLFFVFTSMASCLIFIISESKSQQMKNTNNSSSFSKRETVRKEKQSAFSAGIFSTEFMKRIIPYAFQVSRDLNITTSCLKGLMKFAFGIKEMKIWAFQMLDSSGKIPNGLFRGGLTSLGDYDECIAVSVPDYFQGQYCLVDINPFHSERWLFLPPDAENEESIKRMKDDSVSKHVKDSQKFSNRRLRTSVCVPSTCSADDIKQIVNRVLKQAGTDISVTIPNCETKVEKITFSNSQIVMLIMLLTLLLLALFATIADVLMIITANEEMKGTLSIPVKCILSFSLHTNIQRLLKKDDSPDSIKIFNGMKFITTLWVILNHTYYYLNYQACSSLIFIADIGKDLWIQIVVNGYLSVDTFFFISAVLLSYGVMKSKEEKINIFLYIFRRFWRLSPPFILVMVCVFLLPPLGSGPVWKETVIQRLTEKCHATWWTNLCLINNYVPLEKMCLEWYWYIAAEFQLYLISLIVIIPMKRNPRIAFTLNGIIFFLGTLLTAIFNVYYNLPPTGVSVQPETTKVFVDKGYFRTYLHVSTYCVGLIVGYMLATKRRIQLSLFTNICGWILSLVVPLILIFGAYDWNQGNVPGMLVSALYACTSRLLWSLALGWITITCMSGNGGIVTSFLSWEGFVPLARLTFMVYLVQPVIQFVYIGSTKTLINTEHRTLLHMYFANIVMSYMCATVLGLLFESPFLLLDKLFLEFMQRKKTSQARKQS